jgi:hypothetical protein
MASCEVVRADKDIHYRVTYHDPASNRPPTPPPEPKRPSPMQAETRGLSLGKAK